MNRLPPVVDPVVSPTQTALFYKKKVDILWMEFSFFMKPLILFILKKRLGIMFKVDFDKAYDKIK
jgi:hypothetical protein